MLACIQVLAKWRGENNEDPPHFSTPQFYIFKNWNVFICMCILHLLWHIQCQSKCNCVTQSAWEHKGQTVFVCLVCVPKVTIWVIYIYNLYSFMSKMKCEVVLTLWWLFEGFRATQRKPAMQWVFKGSRNRMWRRSPRSSTRLWIRS